MAPGGGGAVAKGAEDADEAVVVDVAEVEVAVGVDGAEEAGAVVVGAEEAGAVAGNAEVV